MLQLVEELWAVARVVQGLAQVWEAWMVVGLLSAQLAKLVLEVKALFALEREPHVVEHSAEEVAAQASSRKLVLAVATEKLRRAFAVAVRYPALFALP